MDKIYVFLDDKRKDATIVHNPKRGLGIDIGRSNNWIIFRGYDEFVDFVYTNFDSIGLISFDHDISSYWTDEKTGTTKELTGKDAAQFVIDYCMDNNRELPDWFVHSDNSKGNENIRKLLINYMHRVEGRVDGSTNAFGYFQGNLVNHA